MELWDTAGMERFATLSSSYFQSSSAAILCYALNNRDSFNMLSQHILDIIMHSNTAKIFLCGNKKDLEEFEVSSEDLVAFEAECDAVLSAMFQVSCKTGEGVKEMFQNLAEQLQKEAEEKFDPSRVQAHAAMTPEGQAQTCCRS